MSELAERFMNALHKLEEERDVDAMTAFFSEQGALRRAPRNQVYRGAAGARVFWSEYLDAFSEVRTTFGDVTEGDGRVVLEWRSVATNKQGRHIEYDGCSILSGDGEHVQDFRTYYDAASAGMGAAISTQAEAAAARAGDGR